MKIVITDYWYENLDLEKKVIDEAGYELVAYRDKKTEEEVIEVTKDADIVICQFANVSRKVIENMTKCKAIIRYAIGVDIIDVEAATENNIHVCNVPDYGVEEVALHSITLLLSLIRKISFISNEVKSGKWDYSVAKPISRNKGKTFGIIGFGRIPRSIAKKMSGFDMNIIAFDPYVDKSIADKYNVALVTLDELIKTSDYISVNCPLNDSTRHLVNKETISKMKDGVCIVNAARGSVICEKDLIEGLESGKISGAGLDVLEVEPINKDSKLLNMNNVVITPHFAWYSEESVQSLQRMVAEEAVRVLDGKNPKNPVNKIKEQ